MEVEPPPPFGATGLTRADVPAIGSLFARCGDYFLMQDGEPPTLEDAHQLFSDLPSGKVAQDQAIFGWKGSTGLKAMAAILRDYPVAGIWYLGLVLVDPLHRGRGLGRAIYRAVEAWAARKGAREIRLAVLEENERALAFWHSLGFHEVRRVGPDTFKTRSHHRLELSRVPDLGAPKV